MHLWISDVEKYGLYRFLKDTDKNINYMPIVAEYNPEFVREILCSYGIEENKINAFITMLLISKK